MDITALARFRQAIADRWPITSAPTPGCRYRIPVACASDDGFRMAAGETDDEVNGFAIVRRADAVARLQAAGDAAVALLDPIAPCRKNRLARGRVLDDCFALKGPAVREIGRRKEKNIGRER